MNQSLNGGTNLKRIEATMQEGEEAAAYLAMRITK